MAEYKLPGGKLVVDSAGLDGDATFTCTCGDEIILYILKMDVDGYNYEWQIEHKGEEVYKEQVEPKEVGVFVLLQNLLELTGCTIEGVF